MIDINSVDGDGAAEDGSQQVIINITEFALTQVSNLPMTKQPQKRGAQVSNLVILTLGALQVSKIRWK